MGLIESQRLYALHQSDVDKEFPENGHFVFKYIEAMINQIEYRSLSPTIAGVSLDRALVKLIYTTIIGFATSIITYILRNKI